MRINVDSGSIWFCRIISAQVETNYVLCMTLNVLTIVYFAFSGFMPTIPWTEVIHSYELSAFYQGIQLPRESCREDNARSDMQEKDRYRRLMTHAIMLEMKSHSNENCELSFLSCAQRIHNRHFCILKLPFLKLSRYYL